jgi:hypothetical protein
MERFWIKDTVYCYNIINATTANTMTVIDQLAATALFSGLPMQDPLVHAKSTSAQLPLG